MKVFINMRNLLTWPRAMAELLSGQGHTPIFVDNDSDYPPLLEFYASCPWEIRRMNRNCGPSAPWRVLGKIDEPYVVTDPDLDLSQVPPYWPNVLAAGLAENGVKCGLSLVDREVPRQSAIHDTGDPNLANVNCWPEPFVIDVSHVGPVPFHRYPVDTTFAVYAPDVREHQINGIRSGFPYTARHLPWHVVPSIDPDDPAFQVAVDDEWSYYVNTCETGSNVCRFPGMKRIVQQYTESRA